MTDLDRETAAAIDALVYRLKNREPGTDDEPFAQEFVMALRHRGWRPTEARASWQVHAPATVPGEPARNQALAGLRADRGWPRQADQPAGDAA